MNGTLRTLAVLGIASLSACAPGLRIQDRPISFSAEREALTREYIRAHYGEMGEGITIVPRMVVLHWTAIDDLEASFRAFDRETLSGSRPDLERASQVNVSTHFLVDRDGTIYRLMPETWMARHVIGLNHAAIGIENVGGADGVENLTPAQVRANARLVRYLARKYPTIRYLIGHSEYRRFEGHPLWRELDAGYRTEKIDPGERFLGEVRARVADLGLRGPPSPAGAVPGSEWREAPAGTGVAEPRPPIPHRITAITLHHTGSPQPLRPEEDPIERLRGLQSWGAAERNWWDVPYHYLIDLHGRVYEGRDWRYAGETNTAYDPRGHLLISVMGNYELQEPTPAQIRAITDVMAWAAEEFQVPPERIFGHNDHADTSCPGKFLDRYLEDGTFHRAVRARLEERAGSR